MKHLTITTFKRSIEIHNKVAKQFPQLIFKEISRENYADKKTNFTMIKIKCSYDDFLFVQQYFEIIGIEKFTSN